MHSATYKFVGGDVLTVTEVERDVFDIIVTTKRGEVTHEESRLTPFGLNAALKDDLHMTPRVVKSLVAKVRTAIDPALVRQMFS